MSCGGEGEGVPEVKEEKGRELWNGMGWGYGVTQQKIKKGWS